MRLDCKLTGTVFEWDGETPEAILWVDGNELHGKPNEVRRVFNELSRLRDLVNSAAARHKRIEEAIYGVGAELWRAVWR